MKQFSSYFKYFSDSDDVINGIFQNNKIRFTQPWGMNDPLEFNPSLKFSPNVNPYQYYELDGAVFPSIELFCRINIIEAQINSYGILSLTKKPLSFDMWSKYANGHKGFLLEFRSDFSKHPCMKSKDGEEYKIKKVEYVKNYFLEVENILDENNIPSLDKLKDELFFKKLDRWKDEEEYRLVRELADTSSYSQLDDKSYRDSNVYLFDFSLECINSITFGACMSIKNKKKIMEQITDYKIELFQSYIIRNPSEKPEDFDVVKIVNIRNNFSLDELYSLQPQIFIVDNDDDFVNKRNINIKDIKDLPYYKGNEVRMDELYDDLLRHKNK
ncbi:MAG: hypothetical protein UZ14_CFX002000862 [Chloroflexi bacterium OLB14]|nr:MAG: hypothetical protein UZ14_CFX002000862 [Chloroflexi bacterium OLB14]